ncbi:hypothetical protein ACIBK8_13900 [Streptomyces sp. NPDC050161]|uniref:hypothetical protein n=1 Tax=Streptomyces sp. NPDC050161 TaxID=3365604 RepID=UPI00379E6380
MGWAVLYIAFGFVALWLLGEVLFQHKARLRWRLLAFTGFLGVAIGVIIPAVIVIALGAIAFAVGQTYVTLSFRRGFTTGWSLRKPRENRRRRARPGGTTPPAAEPTLEVSGLEAVPLPDAPDDGAPGDPAPHQPYPQGPYGDSQAPYGTQDTYDNHDGHQGAYAPQSGYGGYDGHGGYDAGQGYPSQGGYPEQTFAGQGSFAQDATAVYAPQPLPDETGQYGVYSPDARTAPPGYGAYAAADGRGAADPNSYDHGGGYGTPDGYADPYAPYGDHQGQAPYPDPYTGAQQYPASYEPYEQHDPYGPQGYGAPPYDASAQAYGDTPPGGVWVPQQRDGQPPAEQPPYPPHQQQGYDGQYRY